MMKIGQFKDRKKPSFKEVALDKFIREEDSDDYVAGGKSEEDYEDEMLSDDGKKKKRNTAGAKNKRTQKPKGNKIWDSAFDDNGNDVNEPKPEKKKRVPKPKVIQNPNLIKSTNRLIGDIENKELYDSDESCLNVDREKYFGGNRYN